jgi:hypothetical protein
MKELVTKLQQEIGVSEQQAIKAIDIIKDFAKEKLPIFSGAIDKLFDKYGITSQEDFLD